MPTPSSQPKVCKTCNKPGFADASGTLQHERRANPADSGGRRTSPKVEPKQEPPLEEKPPKREHLLHRKIL